MGKVKESGLEFAIDSNVHIEVISPQNVITQTIDKHNKATKRLVSGIMRFIRGEFNASCKQTDEDSIVYKNHAKYYIPCYIGVGTGGIRLTQKDINGVTVTLPDYDTTNRYNPPFDDTPIKTINDREIKWIDDDNIVNFSDETLYKEVQNKSRVSIGVLSMEEEDEYNTSAGDVQQIVFATDIGPGYYKDIYDGITTDIYITEIGLFADCDPNRKDLLARVIFKDKDSVLYVRPQDTIVVRWTISIIALDDYSKVSEDTHIENMNQSIDIGAGITIDDETIHSGIVDIEDETDDTGD